MILAPLRGVTIRCFREVFAEAIRAAGFTEALTPFITANAGYDPLRDRELKTPPSAASFLRLTPQFIGKDPAAFRRCLERIKAAGYETADLNCGCPYPMVRNKGRGSGLLKTPDVLARMLETGCEVMGPGRFSIKARLGVERNDELLELMPLINRYPLRFLTVHARTAKAMYSGSCDRGAFAALASVAKVPLVENGDIPFPPPPPPSSPSPTSSPPPSPTPRLMIGRSFIRALGERDDIGTLLGAYIEASVSELSGEHAVLGRMEELLSYWQELPAWRRRWRIAKICRTLDELKTILV